MHLVILRRNVAPGRDALWHLNDIMLQFDFMWYQDAIRRPTHVYWRLFEIRHIFDALVVCWRTISQWLFLTHYDAMIIYIDPIWRISDTWHITAPLVIYWRSVTPSSVCRSVRGTISTTSLHYAILSGKSSVFIAYEGERKWRYEWYVYISGQILHQCVCALC